MKITNVFFQKIQSLCGKTQERKKCFPEISQFHGDLHSFEMLAFFQQLCLLPPVPSPRTQKVWQIPSYGYPPVNRYPFIDDPCMKIFRYRIEIPKGNPPEPYTLRFPSGRIHRSKGTDISPFTSLQLFPVSLPVSSNRSGGRKSSGKRSDPSPDGRSFLSSLQNQSHAESSRTSGFPVILLSG